MLQLLEPARTNYDFHFRLAGVPVRVHPFFWLAALLMGIGPETTPRQTIIWMLALLISILIHELGHAVAIRYYGWKPRIVLWILGGLAIYDPADDLGYDPDFVLGEQAWRVRGHTNQIIISLAGPVAGFLFAGLIVGVLLLTRVQVTPLFGWPALIDWSLDGVASKSLYYFVRYLLYINVFWGVVNLLPIFPLDGGQISRELFIARQGQRGMIATALVGIVVGAIMVVVSLLRGGPNAFFGAIFFGVLAFNNYRIYQAFSAQGGMGFDGGRPRHDRRPWDDDDDDEPSWK